MDVVGHRFTAMACRAELDAASEYIWSDARYGLLASQHTEEPEKCWRGEGATGLCDASNGPAGNNQTRLEYWMRSRSRRLKSGLVS